MVNIRKVQHGDENNLAYIQTESWKEAFKDIVPADLLLECTGIERATAMYKRLLDENKGNGYILELDGKPHCIAWWDASREKDMPGYAELNVRSLCSFPCFHPYERNKGNFLFRLPQPPYQAVLRKFVSLLS